MIRSQQRDNYNRETTEPRATGRSVVGYVFTGRGKTSTEEAETYIPFRGYVARGELVGIEDRDRNLMYIARVLSKEVESPFGESTEIMDIAKEMRSDYYDLVRDLIKDPRSKRRFAKLELLYIVGLNKDGELLKRENNEIAVMDIDEPPEPGMPVVKLSAKDYMAILNLRDENDGVCIGKLVERPDVKVCIDKDFYKTHIVVLGLTGMGKSEAMTKIMEEYMRLGIPVIVMDPHGEYVDIGKSRVDERQVYKVNLVRPGVDFTIGFHKLRREEVKLLAQLVDERNPPSVQGLEALADAYDLYMERCVNKHDGEELEKGTTRRREKREEPDCNMPFRALKNFFEETASDYRLQYNTQESIIRRIKLMERMHLWNPDPNFDLDVRQYIHGYNAVVIDYSGAGSVDVEAKILASIFLYRLMISKKSDPSFKGFPLFLVVDEAAHFVPNNETFLTDTFRRLIGEMRKYNLGIALITQSPHKVHPDIFETVDTKILFKLHGRSLDEAEKLGNLSKEDLARLKSLGRGRAFIISTNVGNSTPILVEFDKPTVKHHYMF
jgi:DNA helicase HerA-like ATPase